jgi:transketolase
LSKAITNFKTKKPKLLIAKTVKGKGISFMENNNEWHVGGSKFTQKILNESLNELGE